MTRIPFEYNDTQYELRVDEIAGRVILYRVEAAKTWREVCRMLWISGHVSPTYNLSPDMVREINRLLQEIMQ